MKTKISIIISVYNAEKYLDKCLKSVVDNKSKDVEILVINDGSTDDSLEIIKEYSRKDERISVINLPQNKGLGFGRNIGIGESRGEYIMFVDSDDWIEKDTISVIKYEIDDKTDLLVFGSREIHYERRKKGKPLTVDTIPQIDNKNPEYFRSALMTVDGFKPTVWCYLFSKQLILEKGIKFPETIYFEDIPFTTKILFHAKKVKLIRKVLYNYRVRHDSITRKVSTRKINDNFTAHNLVREFLIEKGVMEKYQNEFIIRILTCCIRPNFLSYFQINEKDKELKKRMKSVRKHTIMSSDSLSVLENAYKYSYSIGNKSLGGFLKTSYMFLFLVKNAYFFTSCIMKIKSALSNGK